MSPNLINLYALVDVTKPYKFIGFGAMDVTKPWAMDVTKPYKFIRFGAMDVTKPYELIGYVISCYAVLLPGRTSGFRAGFRPDSIR